MRPSHKNEDTLRAMWRSNNMYETNVHNLQGASMEEISVKDARENFKDLLDRVAMGEEIVIVRHGKPVARLLPPAPRRKRLPSMAEFRQSIKYTGKPLSQIVIEERDKDRW